MNFAQMLTKVFILLVLAHQGDRVWRIVTIYILILILRAIIINIEEMEMNSHYMDILDSVLKKK